MLEGDDRATRQRAFRYWLERNFVEARPNRTAQVVQGAVRRPGNTWRDRVKQTSSLDGRQLEAQRRLCMLLAAGLADDPADSSIRWALAGSLESFLAGSFNHAGAIAEAMGSVEIEEEALFRTVEERLFPDSEREEVAKTGDDLNGLYAAYKGGGGGGRDPSESREARDRHPAGEDPFRPPIDAFTTAKRLVGTVPYAPVQSRSNIANYFQRKNLGGKRNAPNPPLRAAPADQDHEQTGESKAEFAYYNLGKAPAGSKAAKAAGPSSAGAPGSAKAAPPPTSAPGPPAPEEPVDERLQGIDARLIDMIRNEIMHKVDSISWESIAGLRHAKKTIFEIVIWDLFNGLRGPPKGLLLFGPPGTGKTMIGKCIASQAKATFFSISASSLTSKWVGESEKMVRALFAVARCHQPAVIFIDEIDSMLCQRTDGEFEASRRLKTEFLVQFDGAATSADDRILVIGATNRPQELDEAARRRLVKRLYIPLPDEEARRQIICNLLCNQHHGLTGADLDAVTEATRGYSGSDMDSLCREAALGPIRSITTEDILAVHAEQVRPISLSDFEYALTQVRASVSNRDLEGYVEWNTKYGSLGAT